MSLNVRSTVVASRLAIPHMNSAGGGSIVNTASVGGLIGDSLQSAYGSAKAAVIRLTQYIAVQYGANGVRCNAVRSEEHTSELQSLMRISYAVFCLKKKKKKKRQ